MKRVVITGQGAINALGHSAAETCAAMAAGQCGIGPIEFRDVDRLSIRIGGQVRGYAPEDHFNRQQIALYDRFTQFAFWPRARRWRRPGWASWASCRSARGWCWAARAGG